RAHDLVADDPQLEEADEERGVRLDSLLLFLRVHALFVDAEELVAALLQLREDLVDELEVLLREALGEDRHRLDELEGMEVEFERLLWLLIGLVVEGRVEVLERLVDVEDERLELFRVVDALALFVEVLLEHLLADTERVRAVFDQLLPEGIGKLRVRLGLACLLLSGAGLRLLRAALRLRGGHDRLRSQVQRRERLSKPIGGGEDRRRRAEPPSGIE